MKSIYLFFCMLICENIFSQTVFIPDTVVANAINQSCPGSVVNQYLDTTLGCVQNIHNINFLHAINLEGIQYMHGLKNINLQNQNGTSTYFTIPAISTPLTTFSIYYYDSIPDLSALNTSGLLFNNSLLSTMPALPQSLTALTAFGNINLSTITSLPPNLISLEIAQCNFSSLPPLPANLQHFDCSGNNFSVLPLLPSGLDELSCGYNPLFNLPSSLPPSLTILNCEQNQLTALPLLPPSLIELDCQWNNLTQLPSLPLSLISLICAVNQLTVLPPLPTGLQVLDVSFNLLSSLPTLPNSLSWVVCSNNLITSLPSLPAIDHFYCSNNLLSVLHIEQPMVHVNVSNNKISLLLIDSVWPYTTILDNNLLTFIPPFSPTTTAIVSLINNPISCVPTLTNGIQIYVDSTYVTCVPNLPPSYIISPANLQVCINPPVCIGNNNLHGFVFEDMNQNGIWDATENAKPYCKLKITPFDVLIHSDSSGIIQSTYLDTGSINISATNPYCTVTTPVSFYLGNLNLNDTMPPIGIFTQQGITDLQISISGILPPVPGFKVTHIVNYENFGSDTVDALITYIPDNHFTFLTASILPDSSLANQIYWNIPSVIPGQSGTIIITDSVSVTCAPGTLLASSASISSNYLDNNGYDNNADLIQTVVASFDPNEKTSNAVSIDYNQPLQTEFISYTVNFQNTGTYPASFVMIRDTIDSQFDISTFKIIGASHAFNWQIAEGVLTVRFDNINLPDSISNEPASHGFISYSIKPLSNLQINNAIYNTAYIYFDFNPPVVTNTVQLMLTSIDDALQAEAIFTFPNPVTDFLNIKLSSIKNCSLNIYDAMGKKVYEKKIFGKSIEQIDLSGFNPSIYLLQVVADHKVIQSKILKQ